MRIFALLVVLFMSLQVHAQYEPNDNYSLLVLSYQRSNFSSPVCIGTECHTGVSGLAGTYAHQLVPNLAVGVAGSYLESSGSTSSITSRTTSVFVEGLAGIGRRFDAGLSLAGLNSTLSLCSTSPGICSEASDQGTDVGIFGKAFLAENRALSLTLSVHRVNYRQSIGQTIATLSLVGILARHHRLAFSVNRVKDDSGNDVSGGLGFGYSYFLYY